MKRGSEADRQNLHGFQFASFGGGGSQFTRRRTVDQYIDQHFRQTGQNGSRVCETKPLEKATQTALHDASRLELPQSGDSETLVEVAGIEPSIGWGSPLVNNGDSAHSPEALIKILTNLTDESKLIKINL